jgi:hypothetical protein
VAPWADRCEVVESAVWTEECELVVDPHRPQYGLVVRPRAPGDPADWPVVHARTPDALLDRLGPGQPVDYLFMQVERTEGRLLADAPDWLERVRCMRVEVDGQYGGDPERVAGALARSGMHTRVEPVGWGAFVVGIRTSG